MTTWCGYDEPDDVLEALAATLSCDSRTNTTNVKHNQRPGHTAPLRGWDDDDRFHIYRNAATKEGATP